MLVPLYGFLTGDTLGLLILADGDETLHSLAVRLQRSAQVRVAPGEPGSLRVRYRDQILDPRLTVAYAGLEPLSRFDVVVEGG